jgi:hypothetical protein
MCTGVRLFLLLLHRVDLVTAFDGKASAVAGPWYPGSPCWESLPECEASELLLEWDHRAARIEYDDGQSRGFAEVSAYCAMTAKDASTWHLISVDELARLQLVSGIVDLHYARLSGCSSSEVRVLRDAWRETLSAQR